MKMAARPAAVAGEDVRPGDVERTRIPAYPHHAPVGADSLETAPDGAQRSTTPRASMRTTDEPERLADAEDLVDVPPKGERVGDGGAVGELQAAVLGVDPEQRSG